MSFLNSTLITFLFILSIPSQSFAQIFYISLGSGELLKYNIESGATQNLGEVLHQGIPISLYDIASSPEGVLYGIAWSRLYRIDIDAKPVKAIPLNITAEVNSLTFKPDGSLWGASGDYYSPTLFEIDIKNEITLSRVTLEYSPGGDIAYNPITEKLYIVAMERTGPEALMEINETDGTIINRGRILGSTAYYGMDFFGFQKVNRSQNAVAFSQWGNVVMMEKTSKSWKPKSLPSIPDGCFGATKYHCRAQTELLLNDTKEVAAAKKCGDPLILSGDQSLKAVKYRWSIKGPDVNGQMQEWVKTDFGTPPSLDLAKPNSEFSKFDFKRFYNGKSREFEIELTTWCDTFEAEDTKKMKLSVSPFASLLWEISPRTLGDPKDTQSIYRFPVGTKMVAQDAGTAEWKAAQWILNGTTVETQKIYSHEWSKDEGGLYNLRYEVTHQNDCITEEDRSLKIINDLMFVPNAFSPNGDGINDEFTIEIAPQSTIELKNVEIFDRWGGKVVEATNFSSNRFRWNGGANPVAGVYSCFITYKNGLGSTLKAKSTIEVL